VNLSPGDSATALDQMRAAGVRLVTSEDLVRVGPALAGQAG